MPSEPRIRRAEAADFDAWFELFEQVAVEGRWIGAEAPVDRDDRRDAFRHYLDTDDAVRYLVEIDGRLVGDIFVDLRGGRADLGMMVRDGYRGRGVGSTLMDVCLDWCRATSAHKVTLTVWPHNENALALYCKYGFEVEGRLVRHYRRRNGQLWDAIPMGLVLDDTSPGSPFDDAPGSSSCRSPLADTADACTDPAPHRPFL